VLLPEDLSCQHPLLLVQGWARAFFDKVDPTAHVQMQEATDADDVRDIRIGIRGSQVLASTKAATGRRRPDRRQEHARFVGAERHSNGLQQSSQKCHIGLCVASCELHVF
jgi:hypothetical protein